MDEIIHINREEESLHDFHEAVASSMENIESILILLESGSRSHSEYRRLYDEYSHIIGKLINQSHAIDVSEFIKIFDQIKNFLNTIEKHNIELSGRICEPLLMIMDRIHFMADDAATYSKIRKTSYEEIANSLSEYSKITRANSEQVIDKTIKILTGFCKEIPPPPKIEIKQQPEKPKETSIPQKKYPSVSDIKRPSKLVQLVKDEDKLEDDLAFFKGLADEVDLIHKEWRDRTNFIMPLALGMNALAGNIVDFYQLQAAVYLHDVGMRFLPDELLEEKGHFTEEQRTQLLAHPSWAIENFNLMDGWEEAAWIVYQHHEKFDGTGYPEGTTGKEICHGAQILAICDAFYSIMNRNRKRSVLRAIAEINACRGGHFAPEWVNIFNNVLTIERNAGRFD